MQAQAPVPEARRGSSAGSRARLPEVRARNRARAPRPRSFEIQLMRSGGPQRLHWRRGWVRRACGGLDSGHDASLRTFAKMLETIGTANLTRTVLPARRCRLPRIWARAVPRLACFRLQLRSGCPGRHHDGTRTVLGKGVDGNRTSRRHRQRRKQHQSLRRALGTRGLSRRVRGRTAAGAAQRLAGRLRAGDRGRPGIDPK